MDITRVIATLKRRWYLALVLVLVTIVGTALGVQRVGPTYHAGATILLLPPTGDDQGASGKAPGNPYLELQGLSPARDILVREMTSKTREVELADVYPTASYGMFADQSVAGPIIQIDVTAPEADATMGALDFMLSKTPQALERLQTDLRTAPSEQITSQTLTQDPGVTVVRKAQVRLGIVVAVVLLAGGVLLIGLIDGLLLSRAQSGAESSTRRRERRQRQTASR